MSEPANLVPSFGRLKYVHHTIDTWSHLQWATPLPSEKADSVITHLFTCFAVMGVPAELKTDNTPAYCSRKLAAFLSLYHIHHCTGIPFNSQGQAIIERVNASLKLQLLKLKRGNGRDSPKHQILKALFTLNFLNHWCQLQQSAAVKHFQQPLEKLQNSNLWVYYPSLQEKYLKGKVLQWGRGYALVRTGAGLKQCHGEEKPIRRVPEGIPGAKSERSENIHLRNSCGAPDMGTTEKVKKLKGLFNKLGSPKPH